MSKLKFSRALSIIFFSVVFLGVFNPNIAEAGNEEKSYGGYIEANKSTELVKKKGYNLQFPIACSIISLGIIGLGIFNPKSAKARHNEKVTSIVKASKGEKLHRLYGEANTNSRN
ncbi:MAG: hypothetical protein QNJ34_26475 [Xenococcaceae cyanobacterium MO_188.B29]|nr:hypothetical protein [Xenococcaceae cyanobacterium MO_188.B29]